MWSCMAASMMIIWVISVGTILLLLTSSGESMENTGDIQLVTLPVKEDYGRLGTDILLYCQASLPVVDWKHNGDSIHYNSTISSAGTNLTMKQVKKHQAGTYSCHNPDTQEVIHEMELHLGSPPENLDIKCWASEYPVRITCTCDVRPDTNLPMAFTYGLSFSGEELPGCCKPRDTIPNSCVISNFSMFSDLPYFLNVSAYNKLGSVTRGHHFFVENIIRPDPPVQVTLSPVREDGKKFGKLLLQWRPPPSWPYPHYFPLKYMVRYKITGLASYKEIGPTEKTQVTLTGLSLNFSVLAQVAAKDFTEAGHYSEWSAVATGKPTNN
ncbi:interleukin-27 subunit beta [Hyperolius riggenbachi]|uniref:interleukin-27 subunit beta n=1 Tax=Hyperolius riggenbachi TaxID=752182 RepID=UPI0035A2CD34